MKNNRKIIKRSSEKCKKYIQKSLYCGNNLLSLNNHRICAANKKELKIYNNNVVPKTFIFCFLNLHLNSTYNVATNFLKLIILYHIFVLQCAVAKAEEGPQEEDANGSNVSPVELQGLPSVRDAGISKLCTQLIGQSNFCNSEIVGTVGFFLISTIFSVITGLFYRFCFCVRRCCFGGGSRRRRKEMEEEERYETEMFNSQMRQLQMRQQMMGQQMMGQPMAFPVLPQGNSKKKKKKSKKNKQNSMNVFQVGYQA
ncbi:hypothetical protein, conserved [Plasmodium vivax]|uniref:Uncharacterized protein n=1 Tax=Plasmodium vivax TaxID=5855 RepID=A0A1G4HC89_PLAVI|nr:hypothetical protein, conserved [Plasmodium vivax]